MPAVRIIPTLQGKEVFCKEKSGVIEGTVIRCNCCGREFAPSAFEHHSGSSFRRPWKSIKDINGKSIQEYREEYDKNIKDNEDSIIEPVPSKKGQMEYQIKWETFDDSNDSWFSQNTDSQELPIKSHEENRKRKETLDHEGKDPKRARLDSSQKLQSRLSDFAQETYPSPANAANYSPTRNKMSSPPSPPLFNQSDSSIPKMNESTHSPLLSDEESDSGDEYDYLYLKNESDNENEPIPITAVSVDYMGMKASFIHSDTFRKLLERALEYWEISELTSPKEWVLTNEKDAIWPLEEYVHTYAPEIVYLKRKPSRY